MLNISVVIPFHNRKQYLTECLNSVFAQTMPPCEIIVVDDGSSSDHQAFLSTFSDRVTILRQEGSHGPAAARNLGVDRAKGEFIAFLDDDDIWMPRKLELQAAYFEAHPECDALHTATLAFFSDGSERLYDKKPTHLTLQDALAPVGHVVPSSLMIRAAAFNALDGFDRRLRCSEDREFCIRIVNAGYCIDFIPDLLVRIRRTGHNHITKNAFANLRHEVAIVRKHRDLYSSVQGASAVRVQIAACIRRAGFARGGVLGRIVRLLARFLGAGMDI